MSDLNKVVLCHEKIKSKNLGQNPDNLKHFLLKDFNCDCEDAIKLIDETLAANVIKSVIVNGKVSYRIVRADPVRTDTVLLSETQEIDGKNEHLSTVFLKESLTSQLECSTLPEHQKRDDDNILTIIEDKLRSYFQSTEKRFMKIENHLTGISSSKSTTEPGNVNSNFYTDMLKYRISELEKQLFKKNAVIDFLTFFPCVGMKARPVAKVPWAIDFLTDY